MCRAIFEWLDRVERVQLDCDLSDQRVVDACDLLEKISHWRFVAIERCAFSTISQPEHSESYDRE